jgi:hypothetical protein
MIRTATQLKAKVRNLSGGDSTKAQTLIRNFIGVTLNTYTHLGLIDAEHELELMERAVKMSEKIERRKQRRKSVGE